MEQYLETFTCSDSLGMIREVTKGFSFLEYVYLGKSNFEKARKMAKEYQNGDVAGWYLMTLHEFERLRELNIFEKNGKAWSTEKGKPCIVEWGSNVWGNSRAYIASDKDLNEEFDVYIVH